MTVAKQLYRLQEVDLDIESSEQEIARLTGQLGESQTVLKAQQQLELERKNLEELRHQQHSAEWEIDDLSTKLSAAEEQLFSGRVQNPKELSSLQHEVETFKSRCGQLEEKALGIIDEVERTEVGVAEMAERLEALKAEWQGQQKELGEELEKQKTVLSDLKTKRRLLVDEIDPSTVEFYQQLRKGKGAAVARVEQGICRGCRISLPTTDLQQARSGKLVQCSSCGRILFLP